MDDSFCRSCQNFSICNVVCPELEEHLKEIEVPQTEISNYGLAPIEDIFYRGKKKATVHLGWPAIVRERKSRILSPLQIRVVTKILSGKTRKEACRDLKISYAHYDNLITRITKKYGGNGDD